MYNDAADSSGYKTRSFQEMEEKSSYSFGALPAAGEKIITVVVPVDEDENAVLHAKLIKTS